MADPFALSFEPFTSLSSAQRRLLEQRLRERAAAPGPGGVLHVTRVARDRPLALSFGQERFWLLHHLEPGATVYNNAYLYRFRGTLDVPALHHAALALVQRHESLRTRICEHEGVATQTVVPAAEFPLPLVDLSGYPATDRLAEATRDAGEVVRTPFDLDAGGLLRMRLYRLAGDDHVLLIVVHHIAWDAWSTQVFWHELSSHYRALRNGEPNPAPALSFQYADFAAWQRARLQGGTLEKLSQFWLAELRDLPALELPTDRPRPRELSYAGAQIEFQWPAEFRDALHACARAEQATLFMVLLAGWSALLHRLSGQETVITGTAIAGRSQREFEPLIGFFVNTLALRTDFAAAPTWRQLVQRVRQTTLAAFDHDEMPFEKLIAELRVPRDPGRHPLFQTVLVLHNAPPPEPSLPDVEIVALPRPTVPARFDLALTFTEHDLGLHGMVEFSTDLFDAATIQRWLHHLETLLRFAVAHPDETVARLPLLTDAEHTRLLTESGGAPSPYPRAATVHQLFEEQARKTPAAIALVTARANVTYAELDARANRLAHQLIAALKRESVSGGETITRSATNETAVPVTCIAIDLERSIEFVVSVLAVLKIGAAYVPLLRDLPAERRKFMLEDTRAAALICAGAPAGDVPATVPVIHVGPDLASGPLPNEATAQTPSPALDANSSVLPLATCVTATDAAYVMYTSGSTGRPKGVVIPHQGIVRLVRGTTPPLFRPEDRFLLLASTAFDASTFELWAPLLNGATLAIFPEQWPDFDSLARAVRSDRVTHLFLTAGLFNQVVEHRPDVLAGVTHLFTGGEAMSPTHAARLLSLRPDLSVTNCYGPTEVTTYATTYKVRGDETGSVPIGRPAANCRVYILNPAGALNPVGVPGELHVGGDGLALRYLNLPEVTAARFVADPFNPDTGARMYRTGDRARWRADGNIEFLGRLDDQVKIRGYRIEPGEIAAVLKQHPDVRDAAVLVHAPGTDEVRLVAYVVAGPNRALNATGLRQFLLQRLPDYMVPAVWVAIPQLPLTSNGKLDRRQLPAPELEPAAAKPAAVAPRTKTEKALATVWGALLGRVNFGTDENFFILGGHSLLAMQATARLSRELGREVPVRWWFDHPTIAALAARIDREAADSDASSPIEPVPRTAGLPLSHAEQRLWFLHHVLADPATYHVAWGVRLRGPLDLERLRRALGVVMARQEILRTGYVDHDGTPARIIALECAVPLVLEELPPLAGAITDLMLQRKLANEARRPFALGQPPLWRARCLRLAPDDHVIAFTAHHLICDEWSLPIFHRELADAFGRSAADSPLDAFAPALAVHYADYAVWERREVATRMQGAREFWREHLRGAPSALLFPSHPPATASAHSLGRRAAFDLPEAAVAALEQVGQRENATPFMTWLAAFAALLGRWAGERDVVIGTPFAHRRRPEVQGLIGFFLNTLPVRLRLEPGASFRALVREARATVLAAFEHGALPLDEIAAEHGGARTTAGSALFNVMFVVFDEARPDMTLPGCRADPIVIGTGTAKADLTLFIDRQAVRGPRAVFEFNAEAISAAAVESAITIFLRQLEEFSIRPDTVVNATAADSVPELTPAGRPPSHGFAPPRSHVERALALVWSRVLRRETVGVNDNFFELGGHSLLAMRLVHEMHGQFGRAVPLARLLATPTIAGLADFFAGTARMTAAEPWKGNGGGIPFFYIPGMNGVEFLPAAVGDAIRPDRRWFDGLQHPGVDGREPAAQTIEAIALDLIRQVRAVQPRGPYALGGFCHGGMVAYEMAHQLEAQGEQVAALVLWDTFPYQCWRRRSIRSAWALLLRRLFHSGAGTLVRDRFRFAWHRLALGIELCGRWIRAGLPGARGRNVARVHLAGMRARARYVPRPFHGPVLLVRSRDERVFKEKLPNDGWAGTMLGSCETVDLPRWHYDLLREPGVGELAAATAKFLRKRDDA